MLAQIVKFKIEDFRLKHDCMVQRASGRFNFVEFTAVYKANFIFSKGILFSVNCNIYRAVFNIHPLKFLMLRLGYKIETLVVVLGIHLQRKNRCAVNCVFMERI